MNTYYSYRSYRLGGELLGTLGCGLAWAFFGSGWWSFLLGALLLFLWLPVILGRPYFLTITSSSISWGNSISRKEIPWELIERIGCTPDHESEPGLMIELKKRRPYSGCGILLLRFPASRTGSHSASLRFLSFPSCSGFVRRSGVVERMTRRSLLRPAAALRAFPCA